MQRAEESYQNEIIAAVLSMCKRDKFAMITDFAWYAGILADLAVVLGSQHGGEVAAQLMEVALRVEEVRPFIVETVLSLLFDERLVLSQARHSVAEVRQIRINYSNCLVIFILLTYLCYYNNRRCERLPGSLVSMQLC